MLLDNADAKNIAGADNAGAAIVTGAADVEGAADIVELLRFRDVSLFRLKR